MATLSDVLARVAAYINQDTTIPTGSDLTVFTNFVNQSQDQWADSYVWRKQLMKQYSPTISVSQTSLAMPSDFDRMASPVYDLSVSDSVSNRYFELVPDQRFLTDSTAKYCYLVGDNSTGRALNFNPPLASGASLGFDYMARPASLTTLTSLVTCPSDQYIVLKTIAKILSARSDPRFTIIEDQAEVLMGHMMDDEAAATGGMNNQTRQQFDRDNFRIGEQ